MIVYSLIGVAFLAHVGFAGSKLAVPLFAIEQGGNSFVVGSIVALYSAFPMIFALPAGRLADRIGYRLPLFLGACGIFLGLILPWLWPDLKTLYLAAPMIGMSFIIFQLSMQTLVGAMSSPKDRASNFSILSLIYAIASFFGPLTAGLLIDHVGHARTFAVLSMPLILVVILTALGKRWIPVLPRPQKVPTKNSLKDLLANKALRQTLFSGAIISSAWDVYQFFLPIYGHSNGLSATAIGAVLSVFAVAVIVVRALVPWVVRRMGDAKLMNVALFLAGLCFCVMPLFHSVWARAAVSFFLGLGCGVGQPLSMAMVFNHSPPGRAAEATGLRICLNQMSQCILPLAFGALGTAAGYAVVFIGNSAILMTGAWMGHRFEKSEEARKKSYSSEDQ